MHSGNVFCRRLYLDGVRGHIATINDEQSICNVSFKFSFNSNFTLSHFIIKVGSPLSHFMCRYSFIVINMLTNSLI